MHNALLCEKRLEVVGCELPTSIRLKLFDGMGKLFFYHNFKFDETSIDIRFGMKGINPRIPR
jgi:hypothetical protein